VGLLHDATERRIHLSRLRAIDRMNELVGMMIHFRTALRASHALGHHHFLHGRSWVRGFDELTHLRTID
jgi:hypothetical protein